MRRKEIEPLEKRIVNFFKGDFDKLRDLHPRIGASKAVRLLVRDHINRAEGKVETAPVAPTVEPLI